MKLADLNANTRRRRAAWRTIAFGLGLADPEFANAFRTALNTGMQRLAHVEAREDMRRQADELRDMFTTNPEGGPRCGTHD